MPATKLDELERNKKDLTAIVRFGMTTTGTSPEQLASAMYISIATFYNRLKDPSKFTVEELYYGSRKLHMNLFDFKEISVLMKQLKDRSYKIDTIEAG